MISADPGSRRDACPLYLRKEPVLFSPTRKDEEEKMPLYEYRCAKCGNSFERLVLGGDETIRCPKCGGEVEKLMSSFSIEVPDELCAALPRGEKRELCTECRREGGQCPMAA
jgi:putative FmdB family regulatory protein